MICLEVFHTCAAASSCMLMGSISILTKFYTMWTDYKYITDTA